MATIPRVTVLDSTIAKLFGAASDPMSALEARGEELYPGLDIVVWEGDAATFEFTFVSKGAERLLGYPARRWIDEKTFWADQVVLPSDRDEAIGYCSLATFRGVDHTFEYRATAANGRVLWLRDFVKVIDTPPNKRLRGVMFDVTAEKEAVVAPNHVTLDQSPSRADLGDART